MIMASASCPPDLICSTSCLWRACEREGERRELGHTWFIQHPSHTLPPVAQLSPSFPSPASPHIFSSAVLAPSSALPTDVPHYHAPVAKHHGPSRWKKSSIDKRRICLVPRPSSSINRIQHAARTFEGEKFHKFQGFVAIRDSYMYLQNLGLWGPMVWQKWAICEGENCIFNQIAEVFSLKSFPLYGMQDGG